MDAYARTERLFDRAKKLGLIQHSTGEGAPTVAMVAEMLMDVESDFRNNLKLLALVGKETVSQFTRMEEALEEIAIQKTTGEMDEETAEHSDYEGAYNKIIDIARAALPKKGES